MPQPQCHGVSPLCYVPLGRTQYWGWKRLLPSLDFPQVRKIFPELLRRPVSKLWKRNPMKPMESLEMPSSGKVSLCKWRSAFWRRTPEGVLSMLLSHELIGLSGWVLSCGATSTKSFCCGQNGGSVCEKLIRVPVLMSSVMASVLPSFSVAALVS